MKDLRSHHWFGLLVCAAAAVALVLSALSLAKDLPAKNAGDGAYNAAVNSTVTSFGSALVTTDVSDTGLLVVLGDGFAVLSISDVLGGVGPRGEPGTNGTMGARGANGTAGAPGRNGTVGEAGPSGTACQNNYTTYAVTVTALRNNSATYELDVDVPANVVWHCSSRTTSVYVHGVDFVPFAVHPISVFITYAWHNLPEALRPTGQAGTISYHIDVFYADVTTTTRGLLINGTQFTAADKVYYTYDAPPYAWTIPYNRDSVRLPGFSYTVTDAV